MSKTIFKLFFILFCVSFGQFRGYASSLELRCAANLPSSDLFKEIYGNVGYGVELEGAMEMHPIMELWGHFDWFSKHGHSVGFSSPTRVRIANFSAGLKLLYRSMVWFEPYVGLGPNLSVIWLNNQSFCGQRDTVSKVGVGVVAKSGVHVYFTQFLFLDLFFDYLYQPMSFAHTVNIGGLRTGAGLGIRY